MCQHLLSLLFVFETSARATDWGESRLAYPGDGTTPSLLTYMESRVPRAIQPSMLGAVSDDGAVSWGWSVPIPPALLSPSLGVAYNSGDGSISGIAPGWHLDLGASIVAVPPGVLEETWTPLDTSTHVIDGAWQVHMPGADGVVASAGADLLWFSLDPSPVRLERTSTTWTVWAGGRVARFEKRLPNATQPKTWKITGMVDAGCNAVRYTWSDEWLEVVEFGGALDVGPSVNCLDPGTWGPPSGWVTNADYPFTGRVEVLYDDETAVNTDNHHPLRERSSNTEGVLELEDRRISLIRVQGRRVVAPYSAMSDVLFTYEPASSGEQLIRLEERAGTATADPVRLVAEFTWWDHEGTLESGTESFIPVISTTETTRRERRPSTSLQAGMAGVGQGFSSGYTVQRSGLMDVSGDALADATYAGSYTRGMYNGSFVGLSGTPSSGGAPTANWTPWVDPEVQIPDAPYPELGSNVQVTVQLNKSFSATVQTAGAIDLNGDGYIDFATSFLDTAPPGTQGRAVFDLHAVDPFGFGCGSFHVGRWVG